LLHFYVFVRLDSLTLFKRRGNRKLLIGAGVALWLIFFLGRVYGGNAYGFLTEAIEVAGMHWMGSVFLLAVGLFAADLAFQLHCTYPVSVYRGDLRYRRHDADRQSRHRHLGPPHAPLGARRNFFYHASNVHAGRIKNYVLPFTRPEFLV